MPDTQLNEICNESLVGECKNHISQTEMLKIVSAERSIKTVAKTAASQGRHLLVIIDPQNDFCSPQGSMYVNGATDDIKRLINHIYKNIEHYTTIAVTMDTHTVFSIFHPIMWGKSSGNNYVDPFTVVTSEKIKNQEIVPLTSISKQMAYIKALEEQGSDPLTVWPYHCIKGTVGHAIENQLMHILEFFSLTRLSQLKYIDKGMDPFTEMYGAIMPEYDPTGTKANIWWLADFDKYDSIDIAGEAMDYCVYHTVKQMCQYFEMSNNKKVISKIRILKNMTSPIREISEAENMINCLSRDYGIKIEEI